MRTRTKTRLVQGLPRIHAAPHPVDPQLGGAGRRQYLAGREPPPNGIKQPPLRPAPLLPAARSQVPRDGQCACAAAAGRRGAKRRTESVGAAGRRKMAEPGAARGSPRAAGKRSAALPGARDGGALPSPAARLNLGNPTGVGEGRSPPGRCRHLGPGEGVPRRRRCRLRGAARIGHGAAFVSRAGCVCGCDFPDRWRCCQGGRRLWFALK